MIEKIELQWLLSFQAVYEQLSFKRAAEQLQLPTSNVSRHVALLEQQLSLRLLERTTRKMIPTAAGKQLYQAITPLTRAMNDALEEASLHGDSLSGHLKIIMPDLPFLAEITANFCLQHPQIQLSCDTQLNPSEGLLEGFDLVLRFGRGPLEDSGWVAKEIQRWPSCVVAAPQLLEHHRLPSSLDELSKAPCITSLSVLQGMPWRFKHNQTIQVQSSYKVNSGYMAKAAALKGLGFAILPTHACQADIENGSLIKIDLNCQPEDLVLYAFYSGKKYPLEKVRVFLEHLRLAIVDLDSDGNKVS
ncbi:MULTISPECIES: LysR family transcriptional regulator [unclassified Halomonas]|uniref:LysR family transcriptional regulator n=1 Tax=Halomonas sp. N3-2A TaxID=2014541 RepID=UPI000B5B423B|nr:MULTISPECIES: LysR family transcriptional regulator [unclassified Halomonas]ASK18755.1 LysR family transcriptional regulator [Halomonas sp. N3-2A]UTD54633.1 LysR family transcriptional regulator [Halomonas sp. MS1]